MKRLHWTFAWLAAGVMAFASMAAVGAPNAATAGSGSQVFYQIFFRSFRDSNGDRIGDLRGLTSKLGYIKQLGATTILLTPLQPSPYYHNYFATAFKGIDPAYGTMQDYFAFIRAAHALGLKVYLDEDSSTSRKATRGGARPSASRIRSMPITCCGLMPRTASPSRLWAARSG